MRFLNKQILFFAQTLFLLSALVAVDAGSAVQMQPNKAALPTEALSAAPAKTEKSRSHRCAVWASCNGQRQAVQLNHKKALLLAMAVGLNQGS